MRRLQMRETQMLRAKRDCGHNNNHGGNSQPNRDAAAVFWTEMIDGSKHQDHCHRCERRILSRDAEISYACPSAQGSSNDKIRDQQKRANRSQKSTLLPRSRIHAAAIGKMSAYDDVIEGDDCRERAYSENYGKGGKARRDKSQPEHIGLARAPITIKQRGGALPVNVARPMDACRNNLGHR